MFKEGQLVGESGRFQVRKRLGQGGFGVTYLARDTAMDSDCVIKLMRYERFLQTESGAQNLSRNDIHRLLKREVKRLRRIKNKRVPTFYGMHLLSGSDDSQQYFLSQEYIKGKSLRDLLKVQKKLPLKQCLDILESILNILQDLHHHTDEQGYVTPILHLDIKPDNMLLRSSDNALFLIDFGLSIEVPNSDTPDQQSTISFLDSAGTAGYAAPEQLQGNPVTTSDLYSLGITFMELYSGYSASAIESALGRDACFGKLLQLPESLSLLLEDMTEFRPGRRIQGANEVLQRLRDLQDRAAAPTNIQLAEQHGASNALARKVQRRETNRKSTIGAVQLASELQRSVASPHQVPHTNQTQEESESHPQGLIVDSELQRKRQRNNKTSGFERWLGMIIGVLLLGTFGALWSMDLGRFETKEPYSPQRRTYSSKTHQTQRPESIPPKRRRGQTIPERTREKVSLPTRERPTTQKAKLKPGERRKLKALVGGYARWIPPGTFWMGSPETEKYRNKDEGPVHKVKHSQGFWMMETEVTQAQYQQIMGFNPSWHRTVGKCTDDKCPVESVSWYEAALFANKLSSRLRQQKCYVCKRSACRAVKPNEYTSCKGWRLPTEAEWEYAARATTKTPYFTGECLTTTYANYNSHYPNEGCPVGKYNSSTIKTGSLLPNKWGLYDTSGNVWEWTYNWYQKDWYTHSSDLSLNPVGPESGAQRVTRGGGWYVSSWGTRSAFRLGVRPSVRSNLIGFRLVKSGDE